MKLPRFLLKLMFSLLVVAFLLPQQAKAEHIIGGDIYWECVNTGPDAGKFIFYLKLYRDCSVQNTTISAAGHELNILNHPDFVNVAVGLTLISEQDISNDCGVSCGSAGADDISVREYIFSTAPIALNGVPPGVGYQISYHRCCRNPVDNLVSAGTQEIFYTATMYPYNGQDAFPCYDSSPAFAETPTSILCSGYELRYNSDAIDSDLDSLSYQLVEALGNSGDPVTYTAGYSPTVPLPGPTLDPAYDQVTLNPVSGQLEYDSPSSVQGRWTVVAGVYAWRCGQLISKTIREMSVTIIPCLEPNAIPQVSAPLWASPMGAAGYEITVNAGDLVNFSISGTDNDLTQGVPQVLDLSAAGAQFDAAITGNAGCIAPCATLSNVTPPATGNGTISTTFNWQTTCDHIAATNACATLSSTYNFVFKYRDDFCPARGTNMVNVTVTVQGEDVVDSPNPHCVSTAANGDITLSWTPSTDLAVPPSFTEYVIFHSTSPNGGFQEIATIPNINSGAYVHDAGNAIAPPSTTGPNYYLIRTRSGCNGNVLNVAVDTVSSIFLTVTDNTSTADLAWNAVATPNLPTANPPYEVWRLIPGGVWELLSTTDNLFYSDPVMWCDDELITYRIELGDDLPCTSVSNEDSEILNNPSQPDPQAIDSVSVDKTTGLATIGWSPNGQTNVVEYIIEQNPDQVAWAELFTAVGYTNNFWTNPASNASSESEYYRLKATNACGDSITGVPVAFHRTIFLEVVPDGCTRSATLSWNSYDNWPGGVLTYDIYAGQDGQPPIWGRTNCR